LTKKILINLIGLQILSPLSPRQKKGHRLKSTEDLEDDADGHVRKHHSALKKGARPEQTLDVLKSPPGARKTYAKKDALPKGQTLLSFPVIQPAAAEPSQEAPPTPTQDKGDPSKEPQTPGALARTKYPKRENRKPPAHLADSLGPALFSTPDIIRRVDTPKSKHAPPLQSPTGQLPAVLDMLGSIEDDKGVLPSSEDIALPSAEEHMAISDILQDELPQVQPEEVEQAVGESQDKLPGKSPETKTDETILRKTVVTLRFHYSGYGHHECRSWSARRAESSGIYPRGSGQVGRQPLARWPGSRRLA